MKIRNGFVTNSSSSSFILSFKDENSVFSTLKEQFPKYIEAGWSCGDDGYLQQLVNEIQNADRLTKDNVKEMVLDESWSIMWDLEEKLENEKNMSYSEIRVFFKTSEGKKMIEDACEERINKLLQDIGDDKVIVEVDHGDGGEGEDGVLEHEILPHLSCTRIRFSHH